MFSGVAEKVMKHFLNTNMGLELDNMARLMKMTVDYARSIGYTGDFYIEPKPKDQQTSI